MAENLARKIFQLFGILILFILHVENHNSEYSVSTRSTSFFFSNIFFFSKFQSTINIVFDRVGKIDPVTRGMSILVHILGIDLDVTFWSPHVSFLLVGCIVITSIRGLLLTLTKVCSLVFLRTSMEESYLIRVLLYFTVLLRHFQ